MRGRCAGGTFDAERLARASCGKEELGIDPTMSGDNIYNGAVDNGTGVGVLLELAHAFATSQAPPHPVLFAPGNDILWERSAASHRGDGLLGAALGNDNNVRRIASA
jgi:hypothetical protein